MVAQLFIITPCTSPSSEARQRKPVPAVAVPIGDLQGLLEDDIVSAVEVDRCDVGIVVHHEVATDLVAGAVGWIGIFEMF